MTNFDKYIDGSKKVLLITSQPLDPDCISSGIIMKKYLEHLGLDVTFRFPKKLRQEDLDTNSYMPFFNEFTQGDTRELLAAGDFDTLIILDGINLIQFYDYKDTTLPVPSFDKFKKIIQIDHHFGDPEALATCQIKNTNASSTIEIILSGIVPHDFLDKDLATLAYIGLMGDTGNFRWHFYSNTLLLASMLITKGADPTEAIERMFSMKKKDYMDMLCYALTNVVYDADLHTIFLILPIAKLKHDKIDDYKYRLMRDAFLHDLSLEVADYHRGILVTEDFGTGAIKVSGRGSTLYNKISLPELFKGLGGNGGGHFHASGMETTGDLNEFVLKLKQAIKDKLDESVK